jgi:hypothetical protein
MVTSQLLSEAADAADRMLSPVTTKRLKTVNQQLPAIIDGIHTSPKLSEAVQTPSDKAHVARKIPDETGVDDVHIRSEQSKPLRPVLQERSINMPPTRVHLNRNDPHVPTTLGNVHISPKQSKPLQLVLQEQFVNIPPPRIPFNKPLKSISFAPTPAKLKSTFLKSNVLSQPPSATQAFLEKHLDDFFPSPSQQVRELLDDIDDLPSNTQIAKELNPRQPIDDSDDMFSTQDLLLSPQDLLEITTPSKVSLILPRSR